VKCTVALLVAMLISGAFFGIAVLGVAGVGLPITWLIKTSRRNRKRQFKYTSKLVDNAQNVFSNIKALRAMQRQGTFEQLFDRTIRDLRNSLVKHQITRHALNYGQDLLIALAICAGLFAGAVVYQVPLPELLVLGIVFTQIIGCIKGLQSNYQLFLENFHGYEFCMKVIEQARDFEERDSGWLAPTLQQGCKFEQVSFGFGQTLILDEVSLEIPTPGITVLSGPSGAGKTTIVDLLVGFHQPTKGEILLDGIPLSHVKLKDWRRGIGYVPQELTLLHGSISENVTMGDASIPQEAVTRALAQAGALAFVTDLPQGVDTDVGQMGTKLSGGERQRISLARALVLKPRLLILDEVTSALDQDTEAAICTSVRELSRHYTVVAITHRPAWINVADRVYRIRGGKVASIGPQLLEAEM
jgi:ATP-binding cassette subfamily C protein